MFENGSGRLNSNYDLLPAVASGLNIYAVPRAIGNNDAPTPPGVRPDSSAETITTASYATTLYEYDYIFFQGTFPTPQPPSQPPGEPESCVGLLPVPDDGLDPSYERFLGSVRYPAPLQYGTLQIYAGNFEFIALENIDGTPRVDKSTGQVMFKIGSRIQFSFLDNSGSAVNNFDFTMSTGLYSQHRDGGSLNEYDIIFKESYDEVVDPKDGSIEVAFPGGESNFTFTIEFPNNSRPRIVGPTPQTAPIGRLPCPWFQANP